MSQSGLLIYGISQMDSACNVKICTVHGSYRLLLYVALTGVLREGTMYNYIA